MKCAEDIQIAVMKISRKITMLPQPVNLAYFINKTNKKATLKQLVYITN